MNMGWFLKHSSLILLVLCKNPFFFLCEFKKRSGLSLVHTLSVYERRMWEAKSEGTSQSGLGMIGWLELGKTLYSIFILHGGCFQSVVGSWFFIYSKVFHVKIRCQLSLSLTLLLDLFLVFDIIGYLDIYVEWKIYVLK